MCRLFGLISKEKINLSYWMFEAEIPFIEFSKRVINEGPHGSGWGIAYQNKGKWEIYKEGKHEFPNYNFDKMKDIYSNLFLVHLRRASQGAETTLNAHPFQYKEWVFAHNGFLSRDKIITHLDDKFKKLIKTETDSEVYFMLIIQFYEKTKDIIAAVKETFKIASNFSHKGLNFVMSDGKKLYAYRNASADVADKYDYYSLHYVKRKSEVVIASDALDKESWKSIPLGTLIVVDEKLEVKELKI